MLGFGTLTKKVFGSANDRKVKTVLPLVKQINDLEPQFTDLSDADIIALDYERYHHPHPHVQRKMEALYLKSQGLSHQQIGELCRIRSRTTLSRYFRQYESGGIEALKQLHFKGQPSELNQHIPSLKAHFEAHPPRNSAEAQAEIERITGIKRSPTQIKAFLKILTKRAWTKIRKSLNNL